MMYKVSFSRSALNRIANIHSTHFTKQETTEYQIRLIEAIRTRLSTISAQEGYLEYSKGPWANTRRILVFGYKVYYRYIVESNEIIVKGIKAPRMK